MLLGLIQSLFEGSMYVFVLEWTPALTTNNEIDKKDSANPPIPHGFIFATFMVFILLLYFNSIFGYLNSNLKGSYDDWI